MPGIFVYYSFLLVGEKMSGDLCCSAYFFFLLSRMAVACVLSLYIHYQITLSDFSFLCVNQCLGTKYLSPLNVHDSRVVIPNCLIMDLIFEDVDYRIVYRWLTTCLQCWVVGELIEFSDDSAAKDEYLDSKTMGFQFIHMKLTSKFHPSPRLLTWINLNLMPSPGIETSPERPTITQAQSRDHLHLQFSSLDFFFFLLSACSITLCATLDLDVWIRVVCY